MKNFFKRKKVLIMGLGSYKDGSGIASAEFFAKAGDDVLVTDLRSESELSHQVKRLKKYKNVTYVLGEHREEDFRKCDIVIKNPSVPKDSKYLKIAEDNKIPIHNDWSIFLTKKDNLLLAVTGTRGKSTTTTIINELLKDNFRTHLCGNIGVSPLAIISKVNKGDIIVAELSSWLLYNFRSVKKSPNISVITNLMPDHLNKYKNLEDYYDDKKNIFRYQKSDDILILNKDNKESKKLAKEAKSKIYWFSKKPLLKRDRGVFLKNDEIFFQEDGITHSIANIKKIKEKGEHNKENFLAALSVAYLLGIKKADIQKTINEFKGVENRLEFLREFCGVKFYNDTTATSPDAAIVALNTLGSSRKNIILLAGGADKKLEYEVFAKSIKKYTKGVILFSGDATDKIEKELKNIKYNNFIKTTSSMNDAVKIAIENSKRGDIILLSPGAASFGIFKNEFDRGDKFCAIVKRLK
ncbi:MAG: UDP-N-acetylmuramoyl-L-alanine--D-glutamate ligase [Patescibacteria group bacterium]